MLKVTIPALAFTAALAAVAVSQTTQLPEARTAQPQAPQQMQNLDGQLAACLYLGNQEEVAIARFAQERTKNDKVREFAKKMVKEHSDAMAKLQPLVPRELAAQLASSNREAGAVEAVGDIARQNPPPPQNPQLPIRGDRRVEAGFRGPQQPGAMNVQILMLEREVAQECQKLVESELSEKEGTEFDKCFLGQQACAHIGMLAKLKAFDRHSSGDLKQWIQECQETTKHHMSELKELMKEVDKS